MKILVTGVSGQLGFDVVSVMSTNTSDHVTGVSSSDFDLTDKYAVTAYVQNFEPDAVIHCAAYTSVDRAEDEPERCFAVNADGTRYLAEAVRQTGGKMLYVSTDYVFEGNGSQPHGISSKTNPLNVYGKSKLAGEQEVEKSLEKFYIVRTSWVFGANGGNFVKTMLRLGGEGREIRVVDDQFGSPTYTVDLAALIAQMIHTEKYGIYHATNSGYCSWYEFACEIFRQSEMDVTVHPVSTGEYPTKAKRPQNSRLSAESLLGAGFITPPDWRDALGRFLGEVVNSTNESRGRN